MGTRASRARARPPLEALTPTELRVWLFHLRESLSPIAVAGYVRGVEAFGNRCAAEQLVEARWFRTLRRPQVPHKLTGWLNRRAMPTPTMHAECRATAAGAPIAG